MTSASIYCRVLGGIPMQLLHKHPHRSTVSALGALVVLCAGLYAQDTRPTLAVIDFEGRGIAQLEAQTLADRFRSSIGNTGAYRLVERRMMENVLNEQGFQQTGCTTDECAVEVGKLLGVQYMVGGAIGKVGETFTIDTRMIAVETGESVRTRNVSYVGKVDGLIIEIEILAYEMVEMKPPMELLERRNLGTPAVGRPRAKTKMGAMMRSVMFPGLGQFYSGKGLWGAGWILSELAVAGLIYTNYTSYRSELNDYNDYMEQYRKETNTALIAEHRENAQASQDNMDRANEQIKMLTTVAGGLWLANAVHAFLVGPKRESRTAHKEPIMALAYDPLTRQLGLKWRLGSKKFNDSR